MAPKYEIGQKVRIIPAGNQHLSARDSGLVQHAGQSGEVVDFYWLQPNVGEVFYIYLIQIGTENNKEIVVHEDEIEADVT